MRVLVVTSQFPLPGDMQRGRPIYQTVLHMADLASVSVVSPVATYPWPLAPRSYDYHGTDGGIDAPVAVNYVKFGVLPWISRPVNGWLCSRALATEIASARPDAVLSYWLYPDAYGALSVARRLGIPIVVGARGSDLKARDAISRFLAGSVARKADHLIVVSKDLERVAVRRCGVRPDRVSVIPNGCNSSIFQRRDKRAARAKLGIATEARLLLYVGRLVPEKGLRELVLAAKQLCESGNAVQLALIGDGPMREELRSATSAATGYSIRLLGGQDPAAVAGWMAASDMVVLPSYSEGHPNVLIEALACGRPVVATPVGGISEIVDESSSVLVAPRDAKALARGIREAFERDWDEADLSRRHSRSWNDVARQTLDVCIRAARSASRIS